MAANLPRRPPRKASHFTKWSSCQRSFAHLKGDRVCMREAFPKMHSDQSSCSRMTAFRGALMGRGSCLVAALLLHVARTTSAADQLFCGEHGAAAGGWCRCVDGAFAVNMSQHPLAVSACGLHNGKHHHHHMHLVGHCICVKSEYVGNVEPSNLCGARGRPNTVVVGERTSPRAAHSRSWSQIWA